MKIIEIEKKTGFSSANIIRWLDGTRPIKLIVARDISKKMKLPIEIFENGDLQIKYFGKSYLQKDDTKKGGITTTTREQDK